VACGFNHSQSSSGALLGGHCTAHQAEHLHLLVVTDSFGWLVANAEYSVGFNCNQTSSLPHPASGWGTHQHTTHPRTCMRVQGALAALQQGSPVEGSEGRLKGVLLHSLAGLDPVGVSMFLDAATILRGVPLEEAMAVWTAWHGAAAAAFFNELTRRCLLGVDAWGLLLMHDVLVVLGRGLVLSETPGLESHWGSRVWMEGGNVVGRQQVGPCSCAFQNAQPWSHLPMDPRCSTCVTATLTSVTVTVTWGPEIILVSNMYQGKSYTIPGRKCHLKAHVNGRFHRTLHVCNAQWVSVGRLCDVRDSCHAHHGVNHHPTPLAREQLLKRLSGPS
jgi:hypothetical protein